MKTRKLICMLLVIALVLIPCSAFATGATPKATELPSNTGTAVGTPVMKWATMVEQINQMADLCADMEVFTIENYFNDPRLKSGSGMPLYVLKAGNGEKVIWLEAQIHGNEKFTTIGLMEFLWEYAKDAALRDELKNLTIYAIPIYNVDGSMASWTTAGVANYNNAQRGTIVYRADGTVQAANQDLNRDWRINQRGEGMGFICRETYAYFKLWCDLKPDMGIDMHHQGTVSFATNGVTNPYTMSLGTALNASGYATQAYNGTLPNSPTSIPYAVTLPFIKDYEVKVKQMTKYVYDQIVDDVQSLFTYNSTSRPSGTNNGDAFINPCINIYPGVDVYGGVVSGMMLGVDYDGLNPYRYSCPAWFWEVEQQTSNNTTNWTARYIAIAWQSYYGAKAVCQMMVDDAYKSIADPEDYWKIPHATSGTYDATRTTYGTDRLTNTAPINFAFNETVKTGLKIDAVSAVEEDVEFALQLYQAVNAVTIELKFVVDSDVLLTGIGIDGLDGWSQIGNTKWVQLAGNKWEGSVTLGYFDKDGFGYTSNKIDNIAKFVFTPIAKGTASMTLTGFVINVLDGGIVIQAPLTEITVPTATTSIEQSVWNPYDLNKDNRVSSLDLAICLLYVEFRSSEAAWAAYTKVNDNLNKPVYAYMCDFIDDGVINMLDLIDLMLHYS